MVEQVCVQVPERLCSNVERKVPREVCSPVERQECEPITREECAEKCNSVINFHPLIIFHFKSRMYHISQ